jgi:hypothetical protein
VLNKERIFVTLKKIPFWHFAVTASLEPPIFGPVPWTAVESQQTLFFRLVSKID